jgi:hypothetical protein
VAVGDGDEWNAGTCQPRANRDEWNAGLARADLMARSQLGFWASKSSNAEAAGGGGGGGGSSAGGDRLRREAGDPSAICRALLAYVWRPELVGQSVRSSSAAKKADSGCVIGRT